MKNIIKILALALVAFAIITAFSACDSKDNDAPYVVRTYVNDAQRIIVVMSDGTEIDAGPALKDELPAPEISKLYVNSDYHLMIEYTDGQSVDMGYVGIKDSTVPEPVTITSTEVNENKEFIVRYSDGTEKNLGYVGVEVIKEIEKIVEVEVEIPIFTVTFLGKDGEKLSEQYVIRGKDAKAPDAPEYEHFSFKGWDKSFTGVSSDLIVRATYEQTPKYLVIFEGKDGAILDTQMIYEGEAAIAPDVPALFGYDFVGWDADFSAISGDITVKAIYEAQVHYIVRFYGMNSTYIGEAYVKKGCEAIAPDVPDVDGYTFVGWDKDISAINANLYVYAIYEKVEQYTVTFKGKYGEILSTQILNKGDAATAPSAPAIIGYDFVGWDKEFSDILEDTVVTAIYEEVGYFTVTFKDKDGEIIYECFVNSGCSASAPEAPTLEGFVFTGWDKDFSEVNEDIEVNATYEEIIDEPANDPIEDETEGEE